VFHQVLLLDRKAAPAAFDFFRDAGPPTSARITARGGVISRRRRVDTARTLALEALGFLAG